MDNLKRRGMSMESVSSLCPLCRRGGELIDLLFLHCDVSSSLWRYFIYRCDLSCCMPKSLESMIYGVIVPFSIVVIFFGGLFLSSYFGL